MTRHLRDLPRFPDYVQGQTDHDYIQAAAELGPLVLDRYGIATLFSLAHLQEINDDRWTRQIELDGMRAAGVSGGPMYEFVRDVMLFSNGPPHRARRGPLVRSFAHKVLTALRPAIRARTDRRIGALAGAGPVSFLTQIAGPLPAEVIAGLIGLPEDDTNAFATHVYSAIRGLSFCSDEVRAASDADMAHLARYMDGLIADRTRTPRDDLLSTYLDRVSGGDLQDSEMRAQMIGLVIAGSDTTRGALTSTVSQLLQRPDQWRMLVDDPEAHAPGAVSEGLRFDPIIGALGRITTENRTLADVALPEGTFVSASMLSALRDPEVYANPGHFDITRQDHPRLHPIFGGGPHRCLGEVLARIEMEEALKSLAAVAPDLTMQGPPPVLRGYGAVRQVTDMTVVF